MKTLLKQSKNCWYVYVGLPTQDETVKMIESNKMWKNYKSYHK